MSERPQMDLFAIQAAMSLEDYFSAAAFERKIFSYAPAVAENRGSGPAVVVFPENIGLFLVAMGAGKALAGCADTDEAFARVGRRYLAGIAWAMARFRVANPKTAFWLARANEVRDTMINTFSRFALDHKAYVVAGSASLPRNKHGLSLRPFTPKDGKVYNLSYTFGPQGRLLAETAKVNLVPTMEDTIGLTPGDLADVQATDAGGARLATAICYDGFRCAHTQHEPGFKPLLPQLDRLGAEIVAQPSANPWPWDDPWVFAQPGDGRLRKEQWLDEGAHSALPSMSKIGYLVNPQLVAKFLNLHFDGRSLIFAREGNDVRTIAQARSIDGPEVVHVRVPIGARGAVAG